MTKAALLTKTLTTGAVLGAAAVAGAWVWRHQGQIVSSRPMNEWTFTHMDAIFPTEPIPRTSAVTTLPPGSPLPDLRYQFDGHLRSLSDLHRRTNTTSFLVLYRGQVVSEEYRGVWAHRRARFQAFSVTKSVTSLMIGIALARGEIASIDDPVVNYCPQLRGTGYEGATIAHLLNMSSGVGDVEDWSDPEAPIIKFEAAVTTGGSVLAVINSLPVRSTPGSCFNYSTIDSHILGWVLEAATGKTLAHNAATRLWAPIGAEQDGYYFLTRGKPRTALGGGSLNAATRDLARIGKLVADGGRVGSQQVVPAEWISQIRNGAEPYLRVGALGVSGYPHYGYSRQWWTLGGEHRPITGLGVHGQYLWVDPDRDTVIVKTSAWNKPDDADRDRETVVALQTIVETLAESRTR